MADDGGSTGVLREDFGILPPGDVRRALVALAKTDNKLLSDLFNYRFKEGRGLTGHSFGNLFITALERITGDFEKAIRETANMMGVEGDIFPVTRERTYLMAELEDGRIIRGESRIDIPAHDGNLRINKVWLQPRVKINPNVKKAILNADLVILAPGDLYTSLLPNLLVDGMKEVLKSSRAKVIYFANTMTKFGETNGFRASDFVRVIENYLSPGTLDYVVINKAKPSAMRFRPYVKERAQFVEPDIKNLRPGLVPIVTDLLRPKGMIRHDSDKIARVINMIV